MATQKQQNKVSKVMREFYSGKLTTHGNKVTDPSQAKAIALSEAGVSKKKRKGAKKAKRKYAKGGMVLSNNEIIKDIDFADNTDQRLGRYDFSFETEDSEGASMFDYDGYIIEAPPSSRRNDEIEWGQNVPEDWETAEKILLDSFYEWKKSKYAKGGSTGNIPKSLMDKINEINSLIKWAEDKDNFVGGYFGGTYYEYLDFEKPIETKNQFVYIEYNHGGGRKSSDRYNVNKKGEFDSNGLAELKSELSRILSAFRRAKKKYEQKGYFGEGGDVEKQNKEMVHSQVKEAKHHSEELSDILKEDKDIEAWVVAKMERATTDLSDVTHYLDGKDKSFAGGGGVKFYNKDNEHRLSRPSGSIEKELLDKVRYDSIKQDFVGGFGWKTPQGKLGDGYLYNLDDYDQDLMKNIALRPAERIYRYINRTTAIGGISPLIKMNIEKGLLYFPIYNEADDIIFETRGVKALWINLIEDKYADGGGVDDYTKSLGIVQVKFSDPKYNYETSVSGDITESEARKYFVGKMFDVGSYPKENIQKAIDIEFYPKGTYASGGGVEGDCGCNGGDEYGTGGGVDHECKCDEGGVYNNPFLKSIFGI